MYSIRKMTALLATVAALGAGAAAAQNNDAGLGDSLQAMDGTSNAAIAAATGWHICSINRTGAGWGNHYVALTCPSGPFSNKWHIMRADQMDAMLATALASAASSNDVQVYIGPPEPGSGYNVIRALYLNK